MKKTFFAVLSAVVLSSSLYGCGSEKAVSTAEPSEVVQVECDRVVYRSLEELEKASDLVVIGEYSADAKQNISYEYSEQFGKDIMVDAVSTGNITVKKVLKGDTNKKVLNISQRYGTDDKNRLITFSEMTPMKKGDEWIFFLYYDESTDTYWCSGDYTGRYPVPDAELDSICKAYSAQTENNTDKASQTVQPDADVFGVYDKGLINLDLYSDIISTYNCKV
ncbi:MAG: hypothetical protein PUB97_00765 [Ruminococcus sp.]|nr:hypothetical protein [Ruminococcus sp.]